MSEKRYFWLRLQEDFFSDKAVKKLRRMAGGDTYTIIYLKMQLRSLRAGGVLEWEGLEDTFTDELALDLDEAPDDVRMTVLYLLNSGLAVMDDDRHMSIPYVSANLNSEGASAKRVREFRERKALQCNADETPMKQVSNGDIDIDIEIEKDIDTDTDTEIEKEGAAVFTSLILKDESIYDLTNDMLSYYLKMYPGIDVRGELLKMSAWCKANPSKRKTASGISRFIVNWLNGCKPKPQDKKPAYSWEYTGDDLDKLERLLGMGG